MQLKAAGQTVWANIWYAALADSSWRGAVPIHIVATCRRGPEVLLSRLLQQFGLYPYLPTHPFCTGSSASSPRAAFITFYNQGMSEMPTPQTAVSPLLKGLNPEQMAAVSLPPVHALILAGAGSGKTRVLTTRIAWLLPTGKITLGRFLALTFTYKVATEMLRRLGPMLPVNVLCLWHGTCPV